MQRGRLEKDSYGIGNNDSQCTDTVNKQVVTRKEGKGREGKGEWSSTRVLVDLEERDERMNHKRGV